MSRKSRQPHPVLATAVVLIAISAWLWVRLGLFHGLLLPLTYVLPMLLCVWTRRRWHLLLMASVFALAAGLELVYQSPGGSPTRVDWWQFGATLMNIIVGAGVIALVLRQQERLEDNLVQLQAQNDEIRLQGEELAQQHEELESQGEEMQRQNEELREVNEQLSRRDDMLQAMLEVARRPGGEALSLDDIAARVLSSVGEPAAAALILERQGDELVVAGAAASGGSRVLATVWSLENSVAELVMREQRTAYIDDLLQRADLHVPEFAALELRSVLATPLYLQGTPGGAVLVLARESFHWTQDQFHTLEWIASQCSLILESMVWQQELRETALLAEQNPDAVIRVLSGGTVIYANPAAQRLLRDWGSGVDKAAPDQVLTATAQALADGARRDAEIEVGSSVYAVRYVPVVDREYVNIYAHEITARKRAEDELRTTRDRLESAGRAKDHFLAVLSHELRTPLTPVLTVAGLLEHDRRLPADVRDDVAMIRRNVALETRIIDDLLDVTRIAQGKVNLHMERSCVRELLRHSVEICSPEADAKDIKLSLNLNPAMRSHILGDRARLHQVFWNLIRNAIKFTSPGGHILVHLGEADRASTPGILIEVADNGRGIHPPLLSRLFDAFEQGDPAIGKQFGGLGLGLAISRALVQLHGGEIEAHSDGEGRGSTFRVWLPHAPMAEVTTPLAVMPAPAAEAPRRLKILLVEDHGDTARLMSRVLQMDGHEVHKAVDVAAGLAAAGEQAFDLILSDLGLPDGSGLELIRKLRRAGHTCKAIAVSGYGTDHDRRQSQEAGFDAHITKPASIEHLRAVIRGLFPQPAPVATTPVT
jgi:signal transduction histidine kinase/CheY-like chemotaxis protein